MSILFNLNNFNKISQNQSRADISFNESEIDAILSKTDSASITKEEVEKLYNYGNHIIATDFRNQRADRIVDLLKRISAKSKKTDVIEKAHRYYSELFKKLKLQYELLSKNEKKEQQDYSDGAYSDRHRDMLYLLQRVNEVSDIIVKDKIRQLGFASESNIDEIINEIKLSLPKNKIWGVGILDHINKLKIFIQKYGKENFTEKFYEALSKVMQEPVFDVHDFFGIDVPKFIYLYLGSDRKILSDLSENSDVKDQLVGSLQKYYNVDIGSVKSSYDANTNAGLPIHANRIEWEENEQVKRSFFSIEILKHFIKVLENPSKYGSVGTSSVWFVVDKFFNNISREISVLIDEEYKRSDSSGAYPRSYQRERELLHDMEHFAVTSNFVVSLNNKVKEFKDGSEMKFLDYLESNHGDKSLEDWAIKVKNEINIAITEINRLYESALAYNNEVLDLMIGKSASQFNYIIQRMNYTKHREWMSNYGVHTKSESFGIPVITSGGVEVTFNLKAIDSNSKMLIDSHEHWWIPLRRNFSKELVVDSISIQILNVPIVESTGRSKDPIQEARNITGASIDIYDDIPVDVDLKTGGYVMPSAKTGNLNREVLGFPMYSIKDPEKVKSFLDQFEDEDRSNILESARKQISNFLSDNPDILKKITGTYVRSNIPSSSIEEKNPSHVKKFWKILEDIRSQYISKMSILAGSFGLSDEAFECYGSLGRVVLESKIRDLKDQIAMSGISNVDVNSLTGQLNEVEKLKNRMDEIFSDFYGHGKPGFKSPELMYTGWKSQKDKFPDWLLANLISDKEKYIKSQNISDSLGSQDLNINAERYKGIKEFIYNTLMQWSPYELIDLIAVHKINLGPTKITSPSTSSGGPVVTSGEVKDFAPRKAGEALAKAQVEGRVSVVDIDKFKNMFTSTATGGCSNKCKAFYEAYVKALKLQSAVSTSSAQDKKDKSAKKSYSDSLFIKQSKYIDSGVCSSCMRSKTNVGYDINDWLRMIARKAYIG